MQALEEDIEAFRAILTDYGLEHYRPVGEVKSAGELTVGDVAAESRFAVETARMIYRVLVNYCLLNDRVYAKIIEHEVNKHAENVRLNTLASKFER